MKKGNLLKPISECLGNPQTFQVHALPYVSEGSTARLLGIIRGATAQDEEKSIAHFITENAIEMIAWGKEDGSLIKVNQALCRQSGYSRAELAKMRLTDLFSNFRDEQWEKQYQKVSQGEPQELEIALKQQNGQVLPVYMLLMQMQYHEENYFCAFMRSLVMKKAPGRVAGANVPHLKSV